MGRHVDYSYTYFDGLIDDVRIYDRALSAGEIVAMYKAGLTGGEYGRPLFADVNNGDYHLLSERGRYWPAHDIWVLDEVTSPGVDGGHQHLRRFFKQPIRFPAQLLHL